MAEPNFFSEGNTPKKTDTQWKVLVKILGALRDLITGGLTATVTQTGAPNIFTGQGAASDVSGSAIASRATRRRVTISNLDNTNSFYIGPAGVSTITGKILRAGESIVLVTNAAIHRVAAAGLTPAFDYVEEYD